ncbi:DNA primase [Schaalia canis]|uniref:DNA primase n=1 Tax=Schaalia canis TaxID=100469 RepID=A0A3P1SHI3_9ACTO|nr:DNA primase [Schaalia canis]RRC96487.1 DNA primase [Schaalia canis]
MAGMIRREDIAAVREASRIEDIVGEHVTLRSAGMDSLKGLCPFHDERTPSFHVRPSMGMWHCFGCGEGGDIISFVQRINHMSFTEAVEMLAQKTGITLHYEEGGAHTRSEEPGKRQRLLDAHRVAEEFYQNQLGSPEAHAARTFLAQRGFTRDMSLHFGVGYSPQSWDALTKHLRSRGFTDAEIQAAGLASQGNRGLYDRFRGRLMWPIRDITGATVGFGARRLDDSDKESPKYLNTPETAIYKKSQVLYGLDLAKKAIAADRKIVIVEGYTDVMAAHVAGVPYAVATCGTAFGSEHVKIVRRLLGDVADPAAGVVLSSGRARGGEVIFTFDGDAAGQKAALRAFHEDQNFASQTFVAVEKSGMDPCDLRLARGDQAVKALVESRIPLFEFVIRSVIDHVDLRTVEGRVSALRQCAPIVAGIKDRALRREYTRELAGWLGMVPSEVAAQVRYALQAQRQAERLPADGRGAGAGGGGSAGAPGADMAHAGRLGPTTRPSAGPRQGPEDPVTRVERQALEVLLQRPADLIGSGFEDLDGNAFSVPTHRAVHDAVRAVGGLDAFAQMLTQAESTLGVGEGAVVAATRHFDEAVREMAGDVVGAVVTELAVAPLPQHAGGDVRAYSRGMMAAMVRMDLTRRTADLRAQLQRLSPDDEKYDEVFRQLMVTEQRRQRYSGYERG